MNNKKNFFACEETWYGMFFVGAWSLVAGISYIVGNQCTTPADKTFFHCISLLITAIFGCAFAALIFLVAQSLVVKLCEILANKFKPKES